MIELKNLNIKAPDSKLKKLIAKAGKIARERTKDYNTIAVDKDNPNRVTSILHFEEKPLSVKKNEQEYEIQVTISSIEDPEERTLHNLARKII